MKTKLTLDQLRAEDFFEIINKDELESLIGAFNPPNSCVFNCFDFFDKDAHNWQYYAYETHNNLGYWAGSNGEVRSDDIATIGSYGDMKVVQVGGQDVFSILNNNSDYSIRINGVAYSGCMATFNDGGIDHAVVVTGAYDNGNGQTIITFKDPTFGFEKGAIAINQCNIYGVGAVGSFSSSGSSN